MSIHGRTVRVGAAFALGAWLVSPHAHGVARADDAVTTSGGPAAADESARPARVAHSANGRPDSGARTPQPGSSRVSVGSARVPSPAATRTAGRSDGPGSVSRPDRKTGSASATVTPRASSATSTGGISIPASRPAPAAAASTPADDAPPAVAIPATQPDATVPPAARTAQVDAGPLGNVRTAFTQFVNNSISWLGGLPANPIVDFVSGALLLVRRQLEGPVDTPLPLTPAPLSTGQTFVVSTLSDSGVGSLRQAILDANAAPGADRIDFSVAGVIRVDSTALPSLTDATVLDGTSAPGYSGTPVVRIDFNNTQGLTLAPGAAGSQIQSLSLVDASGAGLTIAASGTTLTGTYIGVWGNGYTVEGNRGDGVLIQAGANGNRIGIGSTQSFVLSNVISGNRGNGITISGGVGNVVQATYIGTDSSGSIRLANRGDGIRMSFGATGNLIGGGATGGNDPVNTTFATPPQGNLISGNGGNGVLIDNGSEGNQLSGNFIGTSASGSTPLGNRKDGVAIVNANDNRLVGTTSEQNPFVFYNVLSGNVGNGLRITDSNNTVVHANFLGIGADNATAVANGGDGMLVNGNSEFVDAGGEIPLGNVMTGNRRYGIEIADTAGGVVSFNNFVGQAAFGTTPVPNWAGGIRITSSNPSFDINNPDTWNKIRTSLIGGNFGNGIEFLGNAHGAEVTDTAVGTDSTVKTAVPNVGAGILVGGNSSQIAIGGFQPSVEEVDSGFSNHVVSNLGFGIIFINNAHDSWVYDTRVGLGLGGTVQSAAQLPNLLGGIFVGFGPSNIAIGGLRDAVQPGLRYGNEIVGNCGDGVSALFTTDLRVLGNTIVGNRDSGVVLFDTPGAQIGAPLGGNTISANGLYGVFASGDLAGTTVQSSTIADNGLAGVRLDWARGVTVGGTTTSTTNVIADNRGWGVLATGWSRGSAVLGNVLSGNGLGGVNTTFALGVTTTSN